MLSLSDLNKKIALVASSGLALALVLMVPELAHAAAVDPFRNLYIDTANWVNGSLGKLLVIGAVIGGGMAAVMGKLQGVLIAFVLALILTFIVPFVESLFVAAPLV